MSKTLRVVYVLVILLLFGCAGTLGALCIHYDRKPEGIIIIGSAAIVLIVSIVVALSGSIKKDDAKLAKANKHANNLPDAPVLMTMNGTVQPFKDGEETDDKLDATVKLFDGVGVHVQVGKSKTKLLKYEDIEDIYKETDDDFFILMPNDIEYKFECSSVMKMKALEDILNKQTNYRFDEGDDNDEAFDEE